MIRSHGHRGYGWMGFVWVAAAGLCLPALVGPAVAAEKGQAEAPVVSPESLSAAFRAIVDKAKPGVVSITVRAMPKKSARPEPQESLDWDSLPDPLKEFFRDRRNLPFDRRFFTPRQPVPQRGMGSGVVVDAKRGYIITNNHVVDQIGEDKDSRIDVRLADGQAAMGKVVGRDPKTDLALLQVTPEGLTLHELPLGDSDSIQAGDLVLAIGAPFGLTQTVTQGIVSATGRSPMIIEGYEDFIQTDAAINPGNSGGPLLNMRGEVVGINTAIVTGGLSAGYVGVGFAVPSATVKELLALWKEGKEIVRGYLGVAIKSLKEAFEPGVGKAYGLSEDKGILIDEVMPGTPAAKAGLKAEDIVLAYGGTEATTVADLQRRVARTQPGTVVDLRIWRDRKEITIPVKIEKQPADYFDASRTRRGPGGREEPGEEGGGELEIETLGMTVESVTPVLAKAYGWEDEKDLEGASVIVTQVEPLGEAAAGLGIREGDLVLGVQGKTIRSGRELRDALSAEALDEGVRLRIKDARTKHTRTLFARVRK